MLFSAQKRSSNYSYFITNDRTCESDKMAVLNSNFLGTEFSLIRNKDNVLVGISYDFNMMGLKGPRKMKVYLPKLDKNNIPLNIKSSNVYIIKI